MVTIQFQTIRTQFFRQLSSHKLDRGYTYISDRVWEHSLLLIIGGFLMTLSSLHGCHPHTLIHIFIFFICKYITYLGRWTTVLFSFLYLTDTFCISNPVYTARTLSIREYLLRPKKVYSQTLLQGMAVFLQIPLRGACPRVR